MTTMDRGTSLRAGCHRLVIATSSIAVAAGLTACGSAPIRPASTSKATSAAPGPGSATPTAASCSYDLTIFAGNGTAFTGGDPTTLPAPGAATSTELTPTGLATGPAGDLYVASLPGFEAKVTPSGALSVVGAPVPGPENDSPGGGTSVAVDAAGDLFVGDQFGYVKKISPTGGLSIVAGNGVGVGIPRPGPATNSPMFPVGLAVDNAGDLYIATAGTDGSSSIGYVDKVTPQGSLSVFAGNGITQGKPVPGPAAASPINPSGIALDSHGNLYIADANGYVEKVTPGGVLSVVAGNGETTQAAITGPATASPMQPSGVAVDGDGNVYIASASSRGTTGVLRMDQSGSLSIIAGNNDSTDAPVAGPACDSPMGPSALAVDASGTLYVGSDGYVLRLKPAAGVSGSVAP